VGSGEAMNEVTLGFDWPPAEIRVDRTVESIQIIKKLWNKSATGYNDFEDSRINNKENNNIRCSVDEDGFVTFIGKYFKIQNAKLYTPPLTNIPLFMAASGTNAIKAAAEYTDGLITTSKPGEGVKETFEIFDNAARNANKDINSLEKIAKPKVSYSEDYDEAFKATEFWRTTQIDDAFDTKINDPRVLEQKAKRDVSDDELKKSTIIVTSIEDLITPIEKYLNAGFTKIYIHSTSPDEIKFIRLFSKKVLTYFRDNWKKA